MRSDCNELIGLKGISLHSNNAEIQVLVFSIVTPCSGMVGYVRNLSKELI